MLKHTIDDFVQNMENDTRIQRLEQQIVMGDKIQLLTTDDGGVVIV